MKTRTSCIGCRYRRPTSGMNPSETVCHYLLDTGVQRGCPADHCTRWRPSFGCVSFVGSIASGGDAYAGDHQP